MFLNIYEHDSLQSAIEDMDLFFQDLLFRSLEDIGWLQTEHKRKPLRIPNDVTFKDVHNIRKEINEMFIHKIVDNTPLFDYCERISCYELWYERDKGCYAPEAFTAFKKLENFDIYNPMSLYDCLELFTPIRTFNPWCIDMIYLVRRGIPSLTLYTHFCTHDKSPNIVLSFWSLVYRAEYFVDRRTFEKLYSNDDGFLKAMSKGDDFDVNVAEIEYYLKQKIFYKVLEIVDGEIQRI